MGKQRREPDARMDAGEIKENYSRRNPNRRKLKVVFEILDNKVVELKQFALAGCEDAKPVKRGGEDFFPITEVQITGRGTRGIHAYKHNASGGSLDFAYQSHKILENEKGKELI